MGTQHRADLLATLGGKDKVSGGYAIVTQLLSTIAHIRGNAVEYKISMLALSHHRELFSLAVDK